MPRIGLKQRISVWLRRVVWVIAGTALSLLLFANALLNSGLPAKLVNDAQEDVHVSFAFAFIVWPTHLHAWGLEVLGHDSHIEWLLTADQASTDFSPSAPFHMLLRARDGHASGIRFWARATRRVADLCTDEARKLPPIPSLANPVPFEKNAEGALSEKQKTECLAQKETAQMPGPTEIQRMWQIDLHHMKAEDVREIWVEGQHFEGSAQASGGFYLWPAFRLRIEPSRMKVASGALHIGKEQAADELSGDFEVGVDPIPVEELTPQKLLAAFGISLRLDAHIPNVGFVSRSISKAKWLKLSHGEGKLHAEGRIERGKILEASRLELSANDLQAHFLDNVATGAGKLVFEVRAEAERSEQQRRIGKLDVQLSSYALAKEGSDRPHIRGKDFELMLRSPDPTLGEPFEISGARLRLPKATAPDLSYYNAYIPRGIDFEILSGSATVDADLEIQGAERLDRGRMTLKGEQVLVRYKKLNVRGDVELVAPLSSASLSRMIFDIPGTKLLLDKVAVAEGQDEPDEAMRDWWGSIELFRGRLRPNHTPFLSAGVRTELRDARPLLAFYAVEKWLPKWVQGLLSAPEAKGTFDLDLGKDLLVIDHFMLSAKSGLTVQSRARFDGDDKRAALLLSYGGHALELEVHGDKTDISILNAGSRFAEGAKKEPVHERMSKKGSQPSKSGGAL